jgi:AI-2 transport protein TqsA
MLHAEAVVIGAGRDRFVPALLAGVYFGRIVLEPVAFVLFAMALVEPFQTAVTVRMGKPIALTLTILLTLLVLAILVLAIIWSIGDVVHWSLANVERFQSLYLRATQWLDGHDLFIMDLSSLNSSSFVGVFQAVAVQVNYFMGFALVVFFCF